MTSFPLVEPAPSPAREEEAGALAVGYRCPECDRVFDRAQALGAHRQRSHGVAGTSKRNASRQSATKRAIDRPMTSTGIDARKVLKAAFPNGIPPTPEAVKLAADLLGIIE